MRDCVRQSRSRVFYAVRTPRNSGRGQVVHIRKRNNINEKKAVSEIAFYPVGSRTDNCRTLCGRAPAHFSMLDSRGVHELRNNYNTKYRNGKILRAAWGTYSAVRARTGLGSIKIEFNTRGASNPLREIDENGANFRWKTNYNNCSTVLWTQRNNSILVLRSRKRRTKSRTSLATCTAVAFFHQF